MRVRKNTVVGNPPMKSLWKHVGNLFVRQRRAEGTWNATLMAFAAVRAMLLHRQNRELLHLEILEKYIVGGDDSDVLFHLSHRHYLSNTFTQRERVECALTHYRYEGDRYDASYKDAVYRNGGVVLWSRRVDSVDYALTLRATTDLRHEGGISVVLLAGGAVLSEMSYAWVDAAVLGLGSGIVPFITRNQSIRPDAPPLLRFREAFPQNSPSYFCFAAVHGVAAANAASRIAGIRHECQVAFEGAHARSFQNSYCEFWKSFGATDSSRVAYAMPVPLATPPISGVKAKHRSRALDRRRHWSEISGSAQHVLSQHVHAGQAIHLKRVRSSPPAVALMALQLPQAALFLSRWAE